MDGLTPRVAATRSAQPATILAVGTIEPRKNYARLLDALGTKPPRVCVIEDIHWADGATLDLLRFLVRRIGRRPVLLVASYRDDELGEQHPLSMLLGDLATAPGMHRIGLERLSANAIAVIRNITIDQS